MLAIREIFGLFAVLFVWLVPLAGLVWLLVLANRAVRALESIAESLRRPSQEG